jgi:colicin import membrane protein
MNHLLLYKLFLPLLLTLFFAGTSNAQDSNISGSKKPDKALYGKSSGGSKKSKTKGPKSAEKAKKDQEKNKKKQDKEYAKAVEENKKRSYDIQSPDVKARMKQNEKDIAARDKQKKKNAKASTKKAGKKYS